MADMQSVLKKLATNPKLMEKLKATKTPEDIVALGKEEGFELDLGDVKDALAEGHPDLKTISHLFK